MSAIEYARARKAVLAAQAARSTEKARQAAAIWTAPEILKARQAAATESVAEIVKSSASKAGNARKAAGAAAGKAGTFAKGMIPSPSSTALLMSSPAFYHLAVKAGTGCAKAGATGTGVLLHGVSKTVGAAGAGVAKGAGKVSPAAGKRVQEASWTCTSFVTDAATAIQAGGRIAGDFTYSVGVSPTVTKAVVRTSSGLFWVMLVNSVSKGRLAAHLAKVPVAGPYLAAAALGGPIVYKILGFAFGASATFGLVSRNEEAQSVFKGTAPKPTFFGDLWITKAMKRTLDEMKAFSEEVAKEQEDLAASEKARKERFDAAFANVNPFTSTEDREEWDREMTAAMDLINAMLLDGSTEEASTADAEQYLAYAQELDAADAAAAEDGK